MPKFLTGTHQSKCKITSSRTAHWCLHFPANRLKSSLSVLPCALGVVAPLQHTPGDIREMMLLYHRDNSSVPQLRCFSIRLLELDLSQERSKNSPCLLWSFHCSCIRQSPDRYSCSRLMGCVWLHAHGGLRNLESRAVKAAEVSRVKEQLAAYSKENSKYKN